MEKPMMKCGHAANATNAKGQPACAICAGIHPGAEEIDPAPASLEGRIAKCGCGSEKPSSPNLAFFERGRYFKGERRDDYDTYYCGCRGWD